jgi:pimeloyl-ACP methyl ester carboxylesterase
MTPNDIHTEQLLYYTTMGNGKPILLLHGFGENGYSWRHLVKDIPHGYKVYVLDLKGFGKSGKPFDQYYSLLDQADIIYSFITKQQINEPSLIGHSLGGGVALLAAMKLISTGKKLSSLTLIDTIAYPQQMPGFISLLRTPLLSWIVTSILPIEFQVRTILQLAYFDDTKITDDQIQAYAEPLKQPGGIHALIETARQIIPGNLEDITSRYSTLKIPTLILWGKEDEIVPLRIGEQLHRAISNSTFRVFDSCGHIPHEEIPEQSVKVIVEFLLRNR